MAHEALKIEVEFRVHEVSCPGVWLDSIDDVWLSIEMFGQKQETNCFVPVFPLSIFEKFRFFKVFFTCYDPSQVCSELEDDDVQIQLIQKTYSDCEIVLANFFSNSRNFLYPTPKLGPVYCKSKRELLIPKTKNFKGTLSPKLHFTTFTVMKSSSVPLHINYKYLYDNPRFCSQDVEDSFFENLKLNEALIHPTSWKEFPDKRTWTLEGHPIRRKCHQCELRRKMMMYPTSWTTISPSFENKLENWTRLGDTSNLCRKCCLLEAVHGYEEELPNINPPKPYLPCRKKLEIMETCGINKPLSQSEDVTADLRLRRHLYSDISEDLEDLELDYSTLHCFRDLYNSRHADYKDYYY